jgi:hypothetical protein
MRGTLHRPALAVAIVLAMLVQIENGVAQAPAKPRRGVVHAAGRAFADEGGVFLARGASLFWALWGYQHDRERLGRNLATLRGWDIDYVRVLGVVGAPGDNPADSWRDRRVDPSTPSYDQDVAAFTDWAYRDYGLRVQWTIFGGVDFAPTPQARRSLLERFARMTRGREQEIFAIEVANEAWQNGFPGDAGRTELHALAKVLKSQTTNLVALSAPQSSNCDGVRSLYAGSAADLVTLHLPRASITGGAIWNTFRDPWSFRDCSGVPALMSSNEPIGPESSVASSDDPGVLAALAAVTYGSGIGAFVLHTGAGVRGGGAADLARARHSNLWELPTGARIADGLNTLIRQLPADLPNWEKHDLASGTGADLFEISPRDALSGMYCFSKTTAYACVAFGIKQPVQLTSRGHVVSVTLSALISGTQPAEVRLQPGGSITIPATPAVRLITGNVQ